MTAALAFAPFRKRVASRHICSRSFHINAKTWTVNLFKHPPHTHWLYAVCLGHALENIYMHIARFTKEASTTTAIHRIAAPQRIVPLIFIAKRKLLLLFYIDNVWIYLHTFTKTDVEYMKTRCLSHSQCIIEWVCCVVIFCVDCD